MPRRLCAYCVSVRLSHEAKCSHCVCIPSSLTQHRRANFIFSYILHQLHAGKEQLHNDQIATKINTCQCVFFVALQLLSCKQEKNHSRFPYCQNYKICGVVKCFHFVFLQPIITSLSSDMVHTEQWIGSLTLYEHVCVYGNTA